MKNIINKSLIITVLMTLSLSVFAQSNNNTQGLETHILVGYYYTGNGVALTSTEFNNKRNC